MSSLIEVRDVRERLKPLIGFLDDLDEAIKFQGTHEEQKSTFAKVIIKLVEESDSIKVSIAKLKEEYQKEKASSERARFAQKTVDDKQQKQINAEIDTLLESKSELEISHEARMKATEKEYADLLKEKKAAVVVQEEAFQRARNDREEYKRKAASW